MVVLMMERAPATLRGELSRWFIEPRAGVFVGNVSAMVRAKLWEKVAKDAPDSGAILIHSAANEQGFSTRLHGDPSRTIVEIEGLLLVQVPQKAKRKASEPLSDDE
ncbi:MAG: type I-E CRISPR-associated endoribonuclease Cas2 [Armatimonadetes bacterium]|nr:type I-E CRISPR-associated endoribonuclease Cas2 [Armatimonadota bacterium]